MIKQQTIVKAIQELETRLKEEFGVILPSYTLRKNNALNAKMQVTFFFNICGEVNKRVLEYSIPQLKKFESVLYVIILHEFGHMMSPVSRERDFETQVMDEYRAECFVREYGKKLFYIDYLVYQALINARANDKEFCKKHPVHVEAWKRILKDE